MLGNEELKRLERGNIETEFGEQRRVAKEGPIDEAI